MILVYLSLKPRQIITCCSQSKTKLQLIYTGCVCVLSSGFFRQFHLQYSNFRQMFEHFVLQAFCSFGILFIRHFALQAFCSLGIFSIMHLPRMSGLLCFDFCHFFRICLIKKTLTTALTARAHSSSNYHSIITQYNTTTSSTPMVSIATTPTATSLTLLYELE